MRILRGGERWSLDMLGNWGEHKRNADGSHGRSRRTLGETASARTVAEAEQLLAANPEAVLAAVRA